MALLSIFCLLLALCSVLSINSTGHFLHITDVHIDPNYDLSGDPQKWCHGSGDDSRNKLPKLGVFGDHNCDSPMALLEFMLREAKAKVPNPNLIIWTGDSLPHDKYDENVLFDIWQNVTNAISAHFPDAVLLPVLGNHDSAPGNSFTDHPAKQQIYEKMFKMWEQWIGPEGKESFTRGGYYRAETSAGLFLVLNTNIYYESNPLRKELVEPDDPTGQFDFLQFELEKARQKGVPVHILGHVPPGAFEEYSVNKLEMEQIPQKYNQKFVDLLVEYAPQIGWIFFGHYHTDIFRVIKNSDGKAVQRFFTAPALTPAFQKNNPAFRVADYNTDTMELENMKTYYVELDELNKNGADGTRAKLEYSMRDAFGGLDAQTLDAHIQKAKRNGTVFDALIRHNHVMYEWNSNWGLNATQRSVHLCALEFVD
ncbi:hypothetical protein niasHT_000415 [Heterodera trifolii]|uniref:Calcineurin-like phosphoesterase domain-containing protein n=1 Tax=Heterodera trifolii TaxID=157864 RepID=A0ABD2M198_9BILA